MLLDIFFCDDIVFLTNVSIFYLAIKMSFLPGTGMLTKLVWNGIRINLVRNASTVGGQPMCALIIGAPGSGKGTISNWIVRDFGLKHVSSGDILRQHLQQGTPVGLKAKQFIDKGDLVPDDTMVELISSELKNMQGLPWLLDGFPRTQPQAKALQNQAPVNVVINLDVPFETIIDRIKGLFHF